MTTHELLRTRLLQRAGLTPAHPPRYRLEDLAASEWSIEFETLMRNRLIMGALRYGCLKATGKPKYDAVASILRRIDLYRETGNLGLLVDVANLCLVEFVEGKHPLRHWHAADDGEHVSVCRNQPLKLPSRSEQ